MSAENNWKNVSEKFPLFTKNEIENITKNKYDMANTIKKTTSSLWEALSFTNLFFMLKFKSSREGRDFLLFFNRHTKSAATQLNQIDLQKGWKHIPLLCLSNECGKYCRPSANGLANAITHTRVFYFMHIKWCANTRFGWVISSLKCAWNGRKDMCSLCWLLICFGRVRILLLARPLHIVARLWQ